MPTSDSRARRRYRGGGGLLTSPLVQIRGAVKKYRELLQTAGKEVVGKGRLSSQTIEELEKPLASIQSDVGAYVTAVNKMWDAQLADLRPPRQLP